MYGVKLEPLTNLRLRRDKTEKSKTTFKRALSEIKEVDSEAVSSEKKQTRADSNVGNGSMTQKRAVDSNVGRTHKKRENIEEKKAAHDFEGVRREFNIYRHGLELVEAKPKPHDSINATRIQETRALSIQQV